MSDNITLSKAKVALLVSVEMNSGNFLCWPIVLGDTIATPSPIFLDVRLDVEIQEEDEEHGTMKEDDIAVFFGKLTINENGKSCMDEEGSKLDQLHSCYISEIFIFIWSLKGLLSWQLSYLFHHRYVVWLHKEMLSCIILTDYPLSAYYKHWQDTSFL